MGKVADYFQANAYQPKYEIGDRVSGIYNGVPFMGSVGNDRLINNLAGPEITIHLDLPMKVEDEFRSIIIAKHKQVKALKELNIP
jgi:hypothetical protein